MRQHSRKYAFCGHTRSPLMGLLVGDDEEEDINSVFVFSRYRCGTGKCHSQLTVEELRSFVRQLYNLPCSLSQAPLLKVNTAVTLYD